MFFCLISADYCVILWLLLDDLNINQQKLYYIGINYFGCNREHECAAADGQNEIVCDEAFYLIRKIKRVKATRRFAN